MDLGLNEKAILITGGSAGLGKALAARLLAEGAQVAICGRDEAKLEAARAELGGDVLAIRADVTDRADIETFVAAAAARFGGIDGVANNAGQGAAKAFEEITDEEWEADLNFKVLGAVRVTRAALPHLRRSKAPAILNSLNSTAKAPKGGSLPSSLSRAAGLTLTKAMSFDLAADKIRVNAICTGLVHSDQWARNARDAGIEEPALIERLVKASGVPAGRFGSPEEWANVAAFLLSPAASYVNGVALNVDGGLSPVV